MTVEIKIFGEDAPHALRELKALSAGMTRDFTPHGNLVGTVTQHTIADTPANPPVIEHNETRVALETANGPIVEQAPKPKRGRPAKATEPAQNIQTQPENRVDPATAAQDAADEAAEQAERKAEVTALTHDDVRAAMTDYLKKYGKVAAMEDGPKILGVAKISEIADDQEKLRKAVDDTASAVANNPFKRAEESVLA